MMGTTNHDEPYWLSWIWAAESDARAYRLVERYLRRPAEELYDTAADPWELGESRRAAGPCATAASVVR